MQYKLLSNDVKMPMLGFGLFQLNESQNCEDIIAKAIQNGYRLFDTASSYLNEEALGNAIRKSGLDRSEFFITTKLWIQDEGYENTKEAIHTSLEKLQTDYIDLYLIHQPLGDYYGSWKAMEEAYEEGILKAIGVSNFYPDRLMDLCMHARIRPMVDQVEMHPFFHQEKALRNMCTLHVQPEAWGPLAEGSCSIFTNPVLTAIGQKHGKTAAQVALRWNIQRGVIVIPRTIHEEYMKENMDIFDFELTPQEMQEINTLNHNHSEIIDHFNPSTVRMLNKWTIHE